MVTKIDVLTETGEPTGQIATKDEAHKKGLWHGGVHIWLFTSKGELLVQQRASTKELFPDLWEIGVAGHVDAGETSLTAAQREIKEELGLHVELDEFEHLYQHTVVEEVLPGKWQHKVVEWVYVVQRDIALDKLKHDPAEVGDVRYVPAAQLVALIGKGSFVPYDSEYVRIVSSELYNMTK